MSPRMLGRIDDPKVRAGAALLRNIAVDVAGAAFRMPGTELVRETRDSSKRSTQLLFRGSGGEDIRLEVGLRGEFSGSPSAPGYIRMHRNGGAVLHSAPWSASITYAVGDLVTNGGELFACKTANTNNVPASSLFWETLEYVTNKPILASAPGASGVLVGTPGRLQTAVAHLLEDDEAVELTGDSVTTAPGGVVYGVRYFVKVVSSTQIELRLTPGGSSIDITTTGAGTGHRLHRSYIAGELVSFSGIVWYCRTDRPISTAATPVSIQPDGANVVHWYEQPATGELEIPTTLNVTESELAELTSSQDEATLSIAHRKVFLSEFRAFSPLSLPVVRYSTFQWKHAAIAPTLSPPGNVVATATKRGDTIGIVAAPGGVVNNGGAVRITTVADHLLTPGLDYVLIEGTGRAEVDGKTFAVNNAGAAARTFDPVSPDTGLFVTFVATGGGGTARVVRLNSDASNSYVVTALDADLRETLQSAEASVANNLFVTGSINTVTWNAVIGAVRYRVYKKVASAGLFGLIGETEATSFVDGPAPDSFAPNLGLTPPRNDSTLAAPTDSTTLGSPNDLLRAPHAVSHHQGRRVLGATDERPQEFFASRSNTESDFTFSIPVQASDRIRQKLKTASSCTIRHLLSMGQLVALTDTTAVQISPVNTDVLTPESFASIDQNTVGSSPTQPVLMHKAGLFVAKNGGHVYAIGFQEAEGGLVAVNQCDRATHLFDGKTITQLGAQMAPVPILWGVSSDGTLRGMTFQPRQLVNAWHQHNTDGVIEALSVGGEGGEDRVYLTVRRTINGATKRFIERVAVMTAPVPVFAENWFVDCGVRYSGAPISTMTGLGHLEGKTVQVFADGLVQTPKVVAGGQITLDAAASTVIAGLGRTAELQTVPAAFAAEAYGSGRQKNVSKVCVRVEASGSFEIGPSLDNMTVPDQIVPGVPFSGVVEVRVPASWTIDGQLFIRVTDPVPLTIVSISAELAVGG